MLDTRKAVTALLIRIARLPRVIFFPCQMPALVPSTITIRYPGLLQGGLQMPQQWQNLACKARSHAGSSATDLLPQTCGSSSLLKRTVQCPL